MAPRRSNIYFIKIPTQRVGYLRSPAGLVEGCSLIRACDGELGRVDVSVVPSPDPLLICKTPPYSSTRERAIDGPSTLPTVSDDGRAEACKKGRLNTARSSAESSPLLEQVMRTMLPICCVSQTMCRKDHKFATSDA